MRSHCRYLSMILSYYKTIFEILGEETSTKEDDENSNNLSDSKHDTTTSNPEDSKHSNNTEASEVSGSGSYDPKNVHYEGEIAVYTEPTSGTQFQWDKDKNEWIPKTNVEYGFEDDTHVYTDTDGTKFFWDKEKAAWFPKVDDDFMAQYQMSYGFIDNSKVEVSKPPEPIAEEKPPEKKPKKDKGEKRKASEPTWFDLDESKNTSVYVSNLPTDITEEEFVEFMSKCGLVMRDPQSGKFKVKLYKESGTDFLKGDALCTYIKVESVDLAMNLLEGYDFRGNKIQIERAKFQMKGDFDPKLKPKMKKKKDKMKMKKQQEKLFDWRPEKKIGDRAKHEKIVVVKNLFDPAVFDTDVGLILEFQQDLREECSKYGEVRKVVIYDRHPEGVAQINMSSPEEADQVVVLLNGRWFMKRQLSAEIWDGKTKFKIAETDSEISKRLDNWDKFLEGEDGSQTEKNKQTDESKQTLNSNQKEEVKAPENEMIVS